MVADIRIHIQSGQPIRIYPNWGKIYGDRFRFKQVGLVRCGLCILWSVMIGRTMYITDRSYYLPLMEMGPNGVVHNRKCRCQDCEDWKDFEKSK